MDEISVVDCGDYRGLFAVWALITLDLGGNVAVIRGRGRIGVAAVAMSLAMFAGAIAAQPAEAVTTSPRNGDTIPAPTLVKDDAFTTPETYAEGTVVTTRWDTERQSTDTIAMSIGNSAGGSLNIVDLTTEMNILYRVLETDGKMRVSKGAYVLPNRQSLLSTNLGELYHVNPNNLTVRKAPPVPGANPPTAFYGVTGGSAVDGTEYTVFVGANNGHAYSFDFLGFSQGTNPAPWKDLGQISSMSPYVFQLAYDAGTLYAGVGYGAAELWKIPLANPAAKSVMTVPGVDLRLAKAVTQTKIVGRYLYATYDAPYPNQFTHVYSLDRSAWIDKEPGMFAITPPRLTWNPEPNRDRVYFRGDYNRLSSYDPRTATNGVKNSTQVITIGSDWPGQVPPNDCWAGSSVCVTVGSRGDFYLNDTVNNTVREVSPVTSAQGQDFYKSAPKGTGITALGPDGRIYMGSEYFSPQYLAIDPAENSVSYLNNGPKLTNGQIEGMAAVNGKLVMGYYRPAKLAQFDPAQPLSSTNTSSTVPASPDQSVSEQARPHAIVDVGNGIAAVGTMPEYDVDSGAVAFYDTTTRTMVGFRQGVVPRQAVESLAHRGGAIIAGTSTNLGRSGVTEEPAAALLRLDGKDDATPTVVYQQGVRTIFSLGFTESGRLYAAVTTISGQSEIREVDPVTLTVIRTLSFGAGGWITLTPLTGEGLAVMGPYHRIYAIDTARADNAPSTPMVEHYVTAGIRPQVDQNGRWYFGKDGDIYAVAPNLTDSRGNPLEFKGFIQTADLANRKS